MRKTLDTLKIYGLSEEDLKFSIFRLAHFQPTLSIDKDRQIVDYLVLDALSSHGSLFSTTINDIQSIIQQHIRLEFEPQEILESVRRLSRNKSINAIGLDKSPDQIQITIKESTNHELTIQRDKLKNIEEQTILQWKEEIIQRYDNDNAIVENIEKIESSLKLFLSRMFLKHGIDSVSILYPENKQTNTWINSIEKQIGDSLPHYNDYLDSIIKIEIPRFIKNSDSKRKKYLTNLFNASFYWHLIHVDAKGSKLLKSITRGQRLLLDNNILYNLVGIGGDENLKSSHKLLELAKQLGYKLEVTNKTLEEFQDSLKWHLHEAKQRPPITSELARLALTNLGQDNFMTSYWNGLASKKLTIEEFVLEISHIHDILSGLDIDIFHKHQKDIDNSEELIDEMTLLKKACGDHFNEHIVEHDAFHRILIKKLRKRTRYNFKDAVAWFLTQDSKLPSYSRYARKGQEYLPFCLTTNQWIQLNRPFLVRTKNESEYEESLVTLITQPFLRSIIPQHPLQDAYEKVLGRLSRYNNMSGELASEITSDTHFMLSIGQLDNTNDLNGIDKIVDDQITKRNNELRKEIEKLRQDLKSDSTESKNKIQKLEKRVEALDGVISQKNEETEDLKVKKDDLITDHTLEISKHKNKLRQKVEDQIEEYQLIKLRKWQNKIWWNLFWVIPFTVVCIWIVLFPTTFNFLENDSVSIRVIIGLFFLVFDGLFLNLIRSRYWDESNKQSRKQNIVIPQHLKNELNELKI